MLSKTDMTQQKIAVACGFCDTCHMSTMFRKTYGAPPSAFRKP